MDKGGVVRCIREIVLLLLPQNKSKGVREEWGEEEGDAQCGVGAGAQQIDSGRKMGSVGDWCGDEEA